MLKKAGLTIVVILILALAVMVIQERIWPPEEALATSSTLTPLSGENVYLNGKKISKGKTVRLKEGDEVGTEEDSWALVTFEDGSTIELEPATEIKIDVLTDNTISVGQQIGRTWSGVENLAGGPVNEFKINTPSADVIAQGALIDTLVEETGASLIAVYEGTVEVTAARITRLIEAGMQSRIQVCELPQVPQPIPQPQNRLECTVEGPAQALLVDWPQQRSIGVVFPDIVVNQLPQSTTTGPQPWPQFTTVPVSEEEGTETYYVVLYGQTSMLDVTVEIEGYSGGEKVFTITAEELELQAYKKSETENKYVARLEITVNAYGNITGGKLGEFMLAYEHPDSELWLKGGPGYLEIKDWAMARADELIAPQANFRASMKEGKITFSNFSTGSIVSYSWDFGDGSNSVEINPSHEYAEGQYTVSLTVISPLGDNDTARITICVFSVPGS